MNDKNNWYRMLPKVDKILETEIIKTAITELGRTPVIKAVQEQLERVRKRIDSCKDEDEDEVRGLISDLDIEITNSLHSQAQFNLRRVINGTGIVLHTNLGRAPLNRSHVEKLTELLTGYSNLEYNLEEGKRGERYSHFEEIICKITGAEAAIAVNNNAAAVLLMISALCREKEVIVSRGEQVEIGGKFRIPDIVKQSGAKLVEVGTTNRTRFSDYEENITGDTGALLKVHTSNYRICGFTENVKIKELVELSHKYEIPVIEDIGSGVLIDLSRYGLTKEPTVMDSIAEGIDLVSFSGDKLLGGPQAGIIAGKKKWIDLLKKHPLMRAIRIDKYTAAMLETTFACYQDEQFAISQIPILTMLTKSMDSLQQSAKELYELLEPLREQYDVNMIDCISMSGGGSLPGEEFKSKGISITRDGLNLNEIEATLRKLDIPVIVRIENDKLLIDMRTVFEEEIPELAKGLLKVL